MTHESTSALMIRTLGLNTPPVALAFVGAGDVEGVDAPRALAPSACSFWRRAESDVFFADAISHHGCSVGAMVMGFELSPAASEALNGLVGEMIDRHYLASDEPAHIPVNNSAPIGILYGPLSKFPRRPDAIMCWLTPAQAMIWNEAAGYAIWSAKHVGSVCGRPSCAAIPHSRTSDTPVLSLGCIGMRLFTEISDNRLLAVIPGARLQEFASSLAQAQETNRGMRSLYAARQATPDTIRR